MRELREKMGGLPRHAEADAIWKDIWYHEAHNSTAIEGNTLVLREVEALLSRGQAVGNKQLEEYLEVRGYAAAAAWVYGQAVESSPHTGDETRSPAPRPSARPPAADVSRRSATTEATFAAGRGRISRSLRPLLLGQRAPQLADHVGFAVVMELDRDAVDRAPEREWRPVGVADR